MFGDRGRYNFEERVYGEIYTKDNEVETTLDVGSLTQITVFTVNGWAKGTTPDHTQDHIAVKKTGIYRIEFHMAVNNESAQGHVMDVSAFTNNGTVELVNIHAHRSLGAGVTDVASMSGGGLALLLVGETLELWATTSGTSDNVTFEDVSLSIELKGPA